MITNLNLIAECGPVHRHFKKQIKSQKDEARTVPLHPDLEAELRSVHDERQPQANDFVFLTDRSHQALQVVRTAFKTGLKKAGSATITLDDRLVMMSDTSVFQIFF